MLTSIWGQNEIREIIVQDAIAAKTNKCQVHSKHMLLHLDEGNGRTTLLRYMSEVFEDHHVRAFLNPDLYIEERVLPTLNELKMLALRIESKAVLANYFSGIIALDVSGLEKCLNDTEYMDFFRQMISSLQKHALMVFFLPEKAGVRTERVECILEGLCDHYIVNVPAYNYTVKDFTDILDSILDECGINHDDSRYPANVREYIQMHFEDLTPYRLKCLAHEIQYNTLYLAPQDKVML